MSSPSRQIECCEHGVQEETFVCQHVVQSLVDGIARGFWWADDPENPRPDAWCTACNEFVKTTGGECRAEAENLAGVKLLCAGCYDRAKTLAFESADVEGVGWFRRALRRLTGRCS